VGAIEERVALLEGRMLEQAQVFADIRETLRSLDQRLTGLERKVDTSVASLHQSLATLQDSMATKQSLATLQDSVATKQSVATLQDAVLAARRDAAIDFRWIVGIQMTVLIAVIAALFSVVAAR
jgi:hypothetical protein